MSCYKALAFALHVLYVLTTLMHTSEATYGFCPPPPRPPPASTTTTLVVYLPVVFATGDNTNATTYFIAVIQGKAASLTQYRSILVTDNDTTETADPNSTVLGRSHGNVVTTALDSSRFQSSLTFSFTAGPYSGRTLVMLGTDNELPLPGNVSVVGWTNAFTCVTEFLTFAPVSMQGPNLVVKSIVTYKTCGTF